MRSLRVWLLLPLAPALASCFPFIFSEEPLGEVAELEPEKWEGSWLSADGEVAFFRVLDAKNGVIDVGGTSCESGRREAIQLRKAPGQRFQERRAVDWYFPLEGDVDAQGAFASKGGLLGGCNADPPRCRYLSTFVRFEGALIMYQIADDVRIKSLVESGVLPGRVEQDEAVLGRLKAEHYDVLYAIDRPVMNWRSGWPFIKLPPEIDPCTAKTPPK